MPRSRAITDDELTTLFGADIGCARAVLDDLERHSGSLRTPPQIQTATGYRLVDVMVVVSRLTYAGLIAHPAHGAYGNEPSTTRLVS